MLHIYLADLIYFGFSSSQLAPKSHDTRILKFADLRMWTEAGRLWVQRFISVWLSCPLLVNSNLVSDEICASLSKMAFRWEKTWAQVGKAAELLDEDVLGATWLCHWVWVSLICVSPLSHSSHCLHWSLKPRAEGSLGSGHAVVSPLVADPTGPAMMQQ